jgi:hypothetical protein
MTSRRHNWERVTFTKEGRPTGRTAKRCRACGVLKYAFHGMTRWRYADGRVHDCSTVDETTCDGGAA